jgi:hypothetical protein
MTLAKEATQDLAVIVTQVHKKGLVMLTPANGMIGELAAAAEHAHLATLNL